MNNHRSSSTSSCGSGGNKVGRKAFEKNAKSYKLFLTKLAEKPSFNNSYCYFALEYAFKETYRVKRPVKPETKKRLLVFLSKYSEKIKEDLELVRENPNVKVLAPGEVQEVLSESSSSAEDDDDQQNSEISRNNNSNITEQNDDDDEDEVVDDQQKITNRCEILPKNCKLTARWIAISQSQEKNVVSEGKTNSKKVLSSETEKRSSIVSNFILPMINPEPEDDKKINNTVISDKSENQENEEVIDNDEDMDIENSNEEINCSSHDRSRRESRVFSFENNSSPFNNTMDEYYNRTGFDKELSIIKEESLDITDNNTGNLKNSNDSIIESDQENNHSAAATTTTNDESINDNVNNFNEKGKKSNITNDKSSKDAATSINYYICQNTAPTTIIINTESNLPKIREKSQRSESNKSTDHSCDFSLNDEINFQHDFNYIRQEIKKIAAEARLVEDRLNFLERIIN